jgi:putative Ca2+/H+ antiporter (TMEM165/GDT1 family)
MVEGMDWKLLLTAFSTVFLAELGDKTQLATLTMAAGGRGKLAVFVGAAAALVGTTAIAVLVGEGLTRVVSPVWLRRIAGVAFLVLGAVYLITAGRGD